MSARSAALRLPVVGVVCAAAIVGALAGKSPSLAFSIALSLAFVPIVFGRFTLGVGLFILSTFLGLSATAQKGIGGLVVIAALAVVLGPPRRLGANFFSAHPRLTALMLAFLGWTFLGVIWAPSSGEVFTSLYRYAPNFLTFFVVYAAVDDGRDVSALAAFFVLGAGVSAAYAILNPPPPEAYSDVTRVGGTFGDPNYLAAVLVTGFALSVAFNRFRSVALAWRTGAALCGVLCLVGIALSVSRGGLIALAVTLLSAILISGRWRLKLGVIALGVALVSVAYFGVFAPATVRDRLTRSDGGSGRTTIWRVGLREVAAHPFRGVGAGNFSLAGAQFVARPGAITHTATAYQAYFIDTPTVAHNTYLEVLAEEGIPGLLLLAAIVAASLWCTSRAWLAFRRAGQENLELLSYAVFAGLLGFLVASFFLSEEYSKQLYVLLALGPALLKVAPPGAGRVARSGRAQRGRARRAIAPPRYAAAS